MGMLRFGNSPMRIIPGTLHILRRCKPFTEMNLSVLSCSLIFLSYIVWLCIVNWWLYLLAVIHRNQRFPVSYKSRFPKSWGWFECNEWLEVSSECCDELWRNCYSLEKSSLLLCLHIVPISFHYHYKASWTSWQIYPSHHFLLELQFSSAQSSLTNPLVCTDFHQPLAGTRHRLTRNFLTCLKQQSPRH